MTARPIVGPLGLSPDFVRDPHPVHARPRAGFPFHARGIREDGTTPHVRRADQGHRPCRRAPRVPRRKCAALALRVRSLGGRRHHLLPRPLLGRHPRRQPGTGRRGARDQRRAARTADARRRSPRRPSRPAPGRHRQRRRPQPDRHRSRGSAARVQPGALAACRRRRGLRRPRRALHARRRCPAAPDRPAGAARQDPGHARTPLTRRHRRRRPARRYRRRPRRLGDRLRCGRAALRPLPAAAARRTDHPAARRRQPAGGPRTAGPDGRAALRPPPPCPRTAARRHRPRRPGLCRAAERRSGPARGRARLGRVRHGLDPRRVRRRLGRDLTAAGRTGPHRARRTRPGTRADRRRRGDRRPRHGGAHRRRGRCRRDDRTARGAERRAVQRPSADPDRSGLPRSRPSSASVSHRSASRSPARPSACGAPRPFSASVRPSVPSERSTDCAPRDCAVPSCRAEPLVPSRAAAAPSRHWSGTLIPRRATSRAWPRTAARSRPCRPRGPPAPLPAART